MLYLTTLFVCCLLGLCQSYEVSNKVVGHRVKHIFFIPVKQLSTVPFAEVLAKRKLNVFTARKQLS